MTFNAVRFSARWAALATLVLAAIVATALLKPIPQPLWYHNFADTRVMLGIPNALNVLSNLSFLLVGVWGIFATVGNDTQSPVQRSTLGGLFAGLVMTGFGSAYYHLAPGNDRLVWDRLPMTLAMAGIVALLLGNRLVFPRWWVLPLVTALGAGTVLQWSWSEAYGHGDLRWYALFEGLVIIGGVALLLMRPLRLEATRALIIAMAANIAAKIFELLDSQIYHSGHLVSGHTLKHLSAGLGFVPLVVWLAKQTAQDEGRKQAQVAAS